LLLLLVLAAVVELPVVQVKREDRCFLENFPGDTGVCTAVVSVETLLTPTRTFNFPSLEGVEGLEGVSAGIPATVGPVPATATGEISVSAFSAWLVTPPRVVGVVGEVGVVGVTGVGGSDVTVSPGEATAGSSAGAGS